VAGGDVTCPNGHELMEARPQGGKVLTCDGGCGVSLPVGRSKGVPRMRCMGSEYKVAIAGKLVLVSGMRQVLAEVEASSACLSLTNIFLVLNIAEELLLNSCGVKLTRLQLIHRATGRRPYVNDALHSHRMKE
jgi:hypothetical protein